MAKGKYEGSRVSAAQKAVRKSSGKSKTKKRRPGSGVALAAIGVAVVLALFVGAYGIGSHLEKGNTIFPNVRVAGVDVGGLTVQAAKGEVEGAIADTYASQTLQVHLPDKTLAFEPQQTKVALDAGEAVQEALSYGRGHGAFRALFNYLSSSGKGYDVELETSLELDTEYIQTLIAQAAKDARQEARNGSVTVNGDTLTVTKGTPGRFLDTDALYEAVYGAFQSGDFTPLEWEYEEIPCVEADLTTAHDSLSTEVVDAHYDAETKKLVEGQSGYGFDLTAAQAQLDSAASGQQFTITLDEIKPEVDLDTLKEEMFGTQLELRSSAYVTNANRTENLRLACEAINGTIINPGEVFSFNDTVGERTAEKGYKPATIYGGEGESTDGVGGGICQVASTIYWAALYLDLETVMREPHMYLVTYVPAGMDATIYWDSGLDYKFRNNREHPLMITANIDGGYVNIAFWGVKENDNYVEMSNATLETWTDEDVEKVDETKPVGYREKTQYAYTGYKVEAYQKVYDGSGKLLKEKTISSTYKSRPNIYIVGPSEEEPVIPEDPWTDPDDPWGDLWGDGDDGDLWGDDDSWDFVWP